MTFVSHAGVNHSGAGIATPSVCHPLVFGAYFATKVDRFDPSESKMRILFKSIGLNFATVRLVPLICAPVLSLTLCTLLSIRHYFHHADIAAVLFHVSFALASVEELHAFLTDMAVFAGYKTALELLFVIGLMTFLCTKADRFFRLKTGITCCCSRPRWRSCC